MVKKEKENDENRKALKEKIIKMRAKRTKREVIVQKIQNQEEYKKKKDKKEEKKIEIDDTMPNLEDF